MKFCFSLAAYAILTFSMLVVPATAQVTATHNTINCVVAADGSGLYKTVQEAVNAVPDNNAMPFVIYIKAGKYEGNVIVPKTKPNIVFEGEGVEKTILSWDRNVNDPAPVGAGQFNPGVLIQANDFRASDLTIENTSGDHGQALALRVDSDRATFENCRLLGWQDTLMVNNGRQYFKNCYIEGRVDFIYGSGTAVFEECHIHSKNGGYVTAASTPQDKPFGFVFLNCKLTGDPNPWVDLATGQPSPKSRVGALAYLGRPWRSFGSVAFLNCEMGEHIRPEGWHNWGNPENEKTARYAEYNNRTSDGKPADTARRVPWAKQLTAEEAANYSLDKVFKGNDNWNPATIPITTAPTTAMLKP